MCDKGVSLYLEDAECSDENLLFKIKEVLTNYEQMSKKAKDLAKSNPTENIVKQLKSIIK